MDSHTTLVLHMDDSYLDPTEAQTSEVPVGHSRTCIFRKKLVGKKRKLVESKDDNYGKDFEAPSIFPS